MALTPTYTPATNTALNPAPSNFEDYTKKLPRVIRKEGGGASLPT